MSSELPRPSQSDFDAHQKFLEALARKLVGKSDLTDDLVQDTWLRFLLRPPPPGRPVRPWLARVLRNRFFEVLRSASSRTSREQEFWQPDRHSSPAELAHRRDLARSLLAAVDSLREPYRSKIRLRYGEGLTAREIAQRSDLPIETVRSQLKRGLAILEIRLDNDVPGGREEWIGGLAAWAGTRRWGWSSNSVLMGGGTLVVALVLVTLGVVFLRSSELGAASLTPSVAAIRTQASVQLVTPEAGRAAVQAEAASASLRVRFILEHSGAPVVGARALFSVQGGASQAGDSNSVGEAVFELPVGPVVVLDVAATELSEARRVELPSDWAGAGQDDWVVELLAVCTVEGRVGTPMHEPVVGALVRAIDGPFPQFLDGGPLRVLAETRTDALGKFRFERLRVEAGLLATAEGGTLFGLWGPPSALRADDHLWKSGMPRSANDYLDGPGEKFLQLQPTGELEVLVLDGLDRPLAGATVRIKGSGFTLREQVTDGHGRANFRPLLSHRLLVLTVTADDHAYFVEGPFRYRKENSSRIVRLPLARTIQGRVVGLDGEPVVGADVRAYAIAQADETGSIGAIDITPRRVEGDLNRVLSDARGEFAVQRLSPGSYLVQAQRQGRVMAEATVPSGERGVVLQEASRVADLRFVGTIRDASTRGPVEGALICVERRRGVFDERVDQNAKRLSGADFDLIAGQAGDWILHVAADGYAPFASLPRPYSAGTHRIDVALQPARDVTLLLEDARGRPVGNAWVRVTHVFTPPGGNAEQRDFSGAAAQLDGNGALVLHEVPVCAFDIHVSARYSLRRFRFEVPPGRTTTAPFRFRIDADCTTPRRIQPWGILDGETGRGKTGADLTALELDVFDSDGTKLFNLFLGRPTQEKKARFRYRLRRPVERAGVIRMVETEPPSNWWSFGPGLLFWDGDRPILPHLRLPPGRMLLKLKVESYAPLEQWFVVPPEPEPVELLRLVMTPLEQGDSE